MVRSVDQKSLEPLEKYGGNLHLHHFHKHRYMGDAVKGRGEIGHSQARPLRRLLLAHQINIDDKSEERVRS